MRNLNETFIDFNMLINHPYNATMQMQKQNETIVALVENGRDEVTTFRDTYNIQPGKSIRPSWEQGYPMVLNNTVRSERSTAQVSFRFKKPVLHKYDNSMIWFNYVYYNSKELI